MDAYLQIAAVLGFAALFCGWLAGADRRTPYRGIGGQLLLLFRARKRDYGATGWRAITAMRVLMSVAVALIVVSFGTSV